MNPNGAEYPCPGFQPGVYGHQQRTKPWKGDIIGLCCKL